MFSGKYTYIACYINLFTRFLPSVFWRSISICLFICSSFSVKNGHPLFICLTTKHHSALYDICIDFRVQPSMIVLLSAESRGQPPKKCHWLMLEDFGNKKSPTKNWIKDVPNPNMRNPPPKKDMDFGISGVFSFSKHLNPNTKKQKRHSFGSFSCKSSPGLSKHLLPRFLDSIIRCFFAYNQPHPNRTPELHNMPFSNIHST